jgi:hypothetical protein
MEHNRRRSGRAEREVRRRILGNLDAEAEMAGLATVWNPRPVRRRASLSGAALAQISGAATLLRAFAREGDRLWTPAPVDPARLPAVPGLPVPGLESGPLPALPPAAAVLAWAETPGVAAHRGVAPAAERRPEERYPLHELLWHLRPAPPEVVAAVHHRAYALELARHRGRELPGARMVDSLPELEAALEASVPAGWVVKAPLSAAGGGRHVERAPGPLSTVVRLRVGRLLARHGPLLFEPWMERVKDVGCAVLLLPEDLWPVGYHRQIVDRDGRFRGIELTGKSQGITQGTLEESDRLLAATVVATGKALETAGYRGPFGIDAYFHQLPDGATVLHPLSEINARMTFGLVARALVDRVREPLGLADSALVRLLFGKRLPEAGRRTVPLLLPDASGGGAAWLEIEA